MSVPNFDPDDHGEEIAGLSDEQRQAEIDQLAFAADMGPQVAKLVAQFEPDVPDGGAVGRQLTPHVARAARARDVVRLWAPGLATTTAFIAVVVAVPLTGPLACYGIALCAYAWWMCAGRPGPIESVRLAAYTASDGGEFVKRHVTRLAVRRAKAEARRTGTTPANPK